MADETPPVSLRTAVTVAPAPNAFAAHESVEGVGAVALVSVITINE
jgi:hypothetical protein